VASINSLQSERDKNFLDDYVADNLEMRRQMVSLGKVTIVILTFNTSSKLGKEFLDKVIQSTLQQSYPFLEVYVVDNGSTDGTSEYVERNYDKKFSNLKVLRLRKNYGWSGGNNQASIFAKQSEFIFFMNDDVILLERDCIYKMVTAMNEDKSLGAIQPLIRNKDGSLNPGADLSISGLISRASNALPFYLSGAALLTRSKTFFQVGMFDEDLFLYHDDVDYCWRLKLAGYKVTYLSDVSAYHYVSATLGTKNPIQQYYRLFLARWVTIKNSSLTWLPLRLLLLFTELTIAFFMYNLFINKDLRKAFMIIRGLKDGLKRLKIAINKRKRSKKSEK